MRSNGASNGQATAPNGVSQEVGSSAALDLVVPAGDRDAELDLVRLRLQLEQLRSERAHLLEAKQELADALEERTRRTQQLLGERAQLEARLREHDQQIRSLNRELGAATRPAPAPHAASGARLQLRVRLAALARHLAVRRKPAGTVATSSMLTPAAVAGWGAPLQPFSKEGKAQPLVLAIVLGLGRDDLPGVLELVGRYCRDRAMTPLLLTDHDGLELFRAEQMLFEYMPPATARHRFAPDVDWDLYMQRRLALIRRKWQPVRIVAFGPHAAGTARLWQSSPFEDDSIKELMGIRDAGATLHGHGKLAAAP